MYLNVDEVDTAVVNLATDVPGALHADHAAEHDVRRRSTCHALRLGGGAAGSRDCVTIIGGQHAREWGSCEILVGFAADLLEAYTDERRRSRTAARAFTAAQIQTLLNGLHLMVFPLVNPDGRAYSQLHDPVQGDAGWRKNRNPANNGGNDACDGVDLNRNYDFLFDLSKFAPGALSDLHVGEPVRHHVPGAARRSRSRRRRTSAGCWRRTRARAGSSTCTATRKTSCTAGATTRTSRRRPR